MIRDLQYRFSAEGRDYVVELSAPGANPAPISAGPFDVHIIAEAPPSLADFDDDEPEAIVSSILEYVRPLVPTSMSAQQWYAFANVVRSWVAAHRHSAACQEWEMERHQMAWQAYEVWQSESNNSISRFAADNDAARAQLEPDAKLTFVVYAESLDEAMAISNELLGFEKYKPMGDV